MHSFLYPKPPSIRIRESRKMFGLRRMEDEKLDEKISDSLAVAYNEKQYNSWFRRMNTDLALVYQNEQKRRQTERTIRALEELTDVIRRKKFTIPNRR